MNKKWKFNIGDKVRINREMVSTFIGMYSYKDKIYTIRKRKRKREYEDEDSTQLYLTTIDGDYWHDGWFELAEGTSKDGPEYDGDNLILTPSEKQLILSLRTSSLLIDNVRKGRKFKIYQEI